MSQAYDDRCEILEKWIEVRNSILHIKNVYDNMSSKHTAYTNFQEMLEEKRKILTYMQRENPWLNDVLAALGKGT